MSSRKGLFYCLGGYTHGSWPCGWVYLARGVGCAFRARIVWPLRRTPRNADLEPEMVGGRGHYLNSRTELGGGVLDLLRTHCERFEHAAEPV